MSQSNPKIPLPSAVPPTTPDEARALMATHRARVAQRQAEEDELQRRRDAGAALWPDHQQRLAEDFIYWCQQCMRVRHKTRGKIEPLLLNRGQLKLLEALEAQRTARQPMRVILLKARQWGGSTMVQCYMLWLQLTRDENLHSYTCAHTKDCAATLRGIIDGALANMPDNEDRHLTLTGFQNSSDTKQIAARGCQITIGTAGRQDASRGRDVSLVHLSEVAYWPDTPRRQPSEIVRAVCSAVHPAPNTLVVMESTANGVGNFFHNEWMRAVDGQSDMTPVFVPWYEVEFCSVDFDADDAQQVAQLWDQCNEYERQLWRNHPITLPQLCWYHRKRLSYTTHTQMQAEFPTTPAEAFTMSGDSVFTTDDVEALRAATLAEAVTPERGDLQGRATTGDKALEGLQLRLSDDGPLQVWQRPERGPFRGDGYNNRYVVGVDIGGRSAGADWSVIAVIDRLPRLCDPVHGRETVVAQWRGHIDHDLLAWKAAQVARYYHDALLVIESNTIESGPNANVSRYVLDTLRLSYGNLYLRQEGENAWRIGFHTNRHTKAAIIANMQALLRERRFAERDPAAVDEFAAYAMHANGSYGARAGCHDDMLMARALALAVSNECPLRPTRQ